MNQIAFHSIIILTTNDKFELGSVVWLNISISCQSDATSIELGYLSTFTFKAVLFELSFDLLLFSQDNKHVIPKPIKKILLANRIP